MKRAPLGDVDYWEKWASFSKDRIAKRQSVLAGVSANPEYMPQYSLDLSLDIVKYILTRYSRGDSLQKLDDEFTALIDAWELSNELSAKIGAEQTVERCRDWEFSLLNLNHYVWCFWLVGLALVFDIPEEQWLRLLVLIGGEGQDLLLDRVIASRKQDRQIGDSLLHEVPYRLLLDAVDAPKEQQADLLLKFVENWYVGLKRPNPKARQAPTIEPFWYGYGDSKSMPLDSGTYFGRWCIEAVVAAKAFGIDDSKCVGHEHYPGELRRLISQNAEVPSGVDIKKRPGPLSRFFGFRK